MIFVMGCSATHKLDHGGTVTGPSDEGDAVVAAVKTAASVYADPEFWKLVEERRWVAGLDATGSLDGKEVRARLEHVSPSAQTYAIAHVGFASFFGHWGANAETASCETARGACGRITINIAQFPWWGDNYLVNTVAHETTHTIRDGAGDCGCAPEDEPHRTRYTDTGHGRVPEAVEVWLVSYAIGDLAQCYANRAARPVRDCFDDTLNGTRCNRPLVECCPSYADTEATADARARSPRCGAIALTCPAPELVSCAYGLAR